MGTPTGENMFFEELSGGMLGIGNKATDYKFGSSEIMGSLLSEQGELGQPKYEYNQGAQYETRNWCTIYSAFTELSYLKNREFTLADIQEVGNAMIEDGTLDPDSGAYLEQAINHVMKWWNRNNPDKIAYYQIDYLDDEMNDILTNKIVRLSQIGYKTSFELYSELQGPKAYASKTDYPKGFGHAVSKYGLNIIDNYKGKLKHNRYSFDKFKELINNGVIYREGYLFLNI